MKCVYGFKGKGGYVKSYVIAKSKRFKGDGIRLVFQSSSQKEPLVFDCKDWEALVVIDALTTALLHKRKVKVV